MRQRTTDAQIAAVAEWYRRKQEIGTRKTIARALGLNPKTLEWIISRIRNPAT